MIKILLLVELTASLNSPSLDKGCVMLAIAPNLFKAYKQYNASGKLGKHTVTISPFLTPKYLNDLAILLTLSNN